MRRLPLPLCVATAGLALALAGCGSPSENPDPAASSRPDPGASTASIDPSLTSPTAPTSPNPRATRVTMTGTVQDGVESGCLVFTDEVTGKRYSVAAEQLPEIGPTTRATVVGTIDPEMMSFCQEGPVLVVEQALEPTD